MRPSFFRDNLASTALGSSGDEEEQDTPVYFFADKEIDESDQKSAEEVEAEKAAEEEKAAKERAAAEAKAAEQAKLDEIARQEKLEEEIKLADEERERMLDEIKKSAAGAFETVEKAIKPFTEIQDGVPKERIQGAAIAATALTFLVSKGVVASGAVGLSAAYLSVSKSVVGDFLRQVGEATWDATESVSKVAGQVGSLPTPTFSAPTFGEVDRTVVNKYKRPKSTNKVDEGELAVTEAEDDEDLTRVLKEAETVIGEADAAIAKAEAEQTEDSEQSMEEELTEIAEIDEEEDGKDEDLEEDDVAEDEEEDQQDDVEEDDGDEMLFDDDQFMAAVELAQEGIEGKIVGVDDIIADESVKAEWDAAGELANELRQDLDPTSEAAELKEEEEDDFDLEFDDIDVEALGRAAREAVETFETEQREAEEVLSNEKQQWADSMIEEDDEFDFGGDEDLFSAESLDAARAAVEASLDNGEDEATAEKLLSKDWSSLKVAELKEELKKRGLKTSGKKADLVALLEESDLSLSDDEEEDVTISVEDADDDEIVDMDDFDIEELGRQARAAVEMFQTNADGFDEEPTEEMLAELESELAINGEFIGEPEPSADFSKMTVAELKDECRSRGLKVGGRKAELIERLENSAN